MQISKKIKAGIKRFFILLKLGWVWNLLKAAQIQIAKLVFRKGIRRKIGDIDRIYLCHDCRDAALPAAWEIDWWKKLTQEIHPGDTIVDVGAYIGVLTVVLARKAGITGRVLAFEPHPKTAALFKQNLKLNGVSGQVEFFDLAIGQDSRSLLLADKGSISRIIPTTAAGSSDCLNVKSGSLDGILGNRKIDIIKIDVEGYEANVLYGAANLLRRKEGSPRFILIECHPHLWKESGVSSKDMVVFLQDAGYAIEMPGLKAGEELDKLDHHWVIFAAKKISA
jgi:FkbM family methyltransferase